MRRPATPPLQPSPKAGGAWVRRAPGWRDRAPKQRGDARCCWVCGELGGEGLTHALKYAGYRVARGEIAYAHPRCMIRAQRQHRERGDQS
jgi:hypothetical protein